MHADDVDVGAGASGDPDGARARQVETLRSWCSAAQVPGVARDPSDLAAVFVAAGRAPARMRGVLEARARAGVGIPVIGDYTALRDDTDRLRALEASAAASAGMRAQVHGRRADLLRRRLSVTRSAVMSDLVVHGGGVRGVRRERREGIHLTVDERERVFTLLCWTPAPCPPRRDGPLALGRGAVADLVELAGARRDAPGRPWPGWEALRRAVPSGADAAPAAEPGAVRFRDPYETLVYLGARAFDRIRASESWRSEAFALQRGRVDLPDELMEMARDTAELHSLAAELGEARRAAGGGAALRRVESRARALAPVWEQLLDRLASFHAIAEAMERIDARVRVEHAAARAASLDDRIDDLVGRAGGHALTTEDMHRVGADAEAGQWALSGYRSRVEREIAELTARRRD